MIVTPAASTSSPSSSRYAWPPPNSRGNMSVEAGLTLVERVLEARARLAIDLADGVLERVERVGEVGELAVEIFLALGLLLELVDRREVDLRRGARILRSSCSNVSFRRGRRHRRAAPRDLRRASKPRRRRTARQRFRARTCDSANREADVCPAGSRDLVDRLPRRRPVAARASRSCASMSSIAVRAACRDRSRRSNARRASDQRLLVQRACGSRGGARSRPLSSCRALRECASWLCTARERSARRLFELRRDSTLIAIACASSRRCFRLRAQLRRRSWCSRRCCRNPSRADSNSRSGGPAAAPRRAALVNRAQQRLAAPRPAPRCARSSAPGASAALGRARALGSSEFAFVSASELLGGASASGCALATRFLEPLQLRAGVELGAFATSSRSPRGGRNVLSRSRLISSPRAMTPT